MAGERPVCLVCVLCQVGDQVLTPEFSSVLEETAMGCDMVFLQVQQCIAGSNSTIYPTSDLGLLGVLLHVVLLLVVRTRCAHVWASYSGAHCRDSSSKRHAIWCLAQLFVDAARTTSSLSL